MTKATESSPGRERWNSRTSFIMAAIGSAIGLGNVWRFPYVAYEGGGGAFLIPYFVALFTAGIPMLILEIALGHRMQQGAPLAYGKIRKSFEWLGWWAAGLSAGIVIYYVTILAWSWIYLYHSLSLSWGENTEPFFFKAVLRQSSGPAQLGTLVWPLVIGMALTWLSIYLILRRGVRNVGKVVWVTVPLPILLLVFILFRGLTLPGAMDGIRYYLTPDFSKLVSPGIWLRAYGQIFFSLSLASGVMIGYGSYLGKKSEITNSALITAFANCGTSFLAGFSVFSMLGYLAQTQGLSVPNVTTSGTGLAFVTFPLAITKLPALNVLFGIVFFIMLLTLGIDSAFALQEAFTTGFQDKWKVSPAKISLYFILIAFPLSLIFVTRGGFYWFDIADKWICDFGLVFSGLLQCIVIGFVYNIRDFRMYINSMSEVTLGKWWEIAIRYLTPGILLITLLVNLSHAFTKPYGNYPPWTLWVGGWGVLGLIAIVGCVLWRIKGK